MDEWAERANSHLKNNYDISLPHSSKIAIELTILLIDIFIKLFNLRCIVVILKLFQIGDVFYLQVIYKATI